LKIAISGKGGTGKSTVASLLVHYFNNSNYKVLAVDADPDANFASAIGFPPEIIKKITPISVQRRLIKERTGANPTEFGQLFKINPKVDDIPDNFCYEINGIKLIVLGSVKKGGSGCACPENILLRSLLSEIILNRNEIVIVDMEAGIEHLGRSTTKSIDKMIIIVEPGQRSIETARSVMNLGNDIGLTNYGIIGNKIRTAEQENWIKEQFDPSLMLGMISYNDIIQTADQTGTPLIANMDDKLKKEFDIIFRKLNPQ
jgi:CO dehydrogenase maturation factor